MGFGFLADRTTFVIATRHPPHTLTLHRGALSSSFLLREHATMLRPPSEREPHHAAVQWLLTSCGCGWIAAMWAMLRLPPSQASQVATMKRREAMQSRIVCRLRRRQADRAKIAPEWHAASSGLLGTAAIAPRRRSAVMMARGSAASWSRPSNLGERGPVPHPIIEALAVRDHTRGGGFILSG